MYSEIYTILSKFIPYPILTAIVTIIALIVVVLVVVTLVVVILIWVERKFAARVQSRYGPVYVGPFGLLQNIADFIKLFGKAFAVRDVDTLTYNFVPIGLAAASFVMLSIIPLGYSNLAVVNIPFNLLFIYVLLAISPFLVLLGGWGENNKYGLIGGFRGAAQIIAYELALMVVFFSVATISGSYDIASIVSAQVSHWNVLYLPLTLAVFILSAFAVIERAPFDIPEAPQELMVGWEVEYGGMKYGLFAMADYVRLFVICMLIVYLFFGGWLGPAWLSPIFSFWIKTFITIMAVISVRWALNRPRIDQIIRFGWNWLLPLSIANLLIAGVILFI